jgi:trehalose 6-phosphate synthase
VQHRLHDLKTSPALGREERSAFEDGYVGGQRLAPDAVVEQLEAAGGRPSCCCTTTTSTSSATSSGSAAPTRLISHFVHIPWPGPETWQVLPPDMRERPAGSACSAATSVAFHTRPDARAFVLCAQELLDLPSTWRA